MNLTSPKNLKTAKLGDVCKSISETFDFSNTEEVVFINTGNVTDGKFLHSNLMNTKKLPGQAKKKFQKGDILYSEIRPINRHFALVDFDSSNYVASTKLMILRTNESIDVKYFYTWITSYEVLREMQSIAEARSGTFPQLTFDSISKLEIPVPESIDEQREIAAILGSLDDKIELLRRENKTLESIAQTLFREWFVDFRFPGYENVKMVDELPEGWKVGTVMDVIDRLSISYKCDKDDLDPQGKIPIIDQGATGLYGYTKRDPDVVASTENPVILFTNHTCNLWFINYPFCAIQNVIPFKGKDGYDEYFVYFMTKGQVNFIEYKGHWPDFEIKEYIIPSVETAKQFSEKVKPLIHKTWNNNSEIQTLSRLRDDLLNKIFNV